MQGGAGNARGAQRAPVDRPTRAGRSGQALGLAGSCASGRLPHRRDPAERAGSAGGALASKQREQAQPRSVGHDLAALDDSTRSARRWIISSSWDVISTAAPSRAAISRRSPSSVTADSTSSPSVGSQSRSSGARAMRARAVARRWGRPAEGAWASLSAWGPRPSASMSAPRRPLRALGLCRGAERSNPDILRGRSCARGRLGSPPGRPPPWKPPGSARATSPAVGSTRPNTHLSVVASPEPLAPKSQYGRRLCLDARRLLCSARRPSYAAS